MRPLKSTLRIVMALWLVLSAKPALALEKLSFVTDWVAEAEHGGFYEAKALGLYEAHGLDVTIRQGGATVNVPLLLAAGAADLGIGSNSFIPLNLIKAGAKVKAVMAVFQKDPQVLITHPRPDIKSIADMRGRPIMISDASIPTIWVWLKARYGFADSQIRKYTNNLAPFLVDPKAIQQGYVMAEPFLIEKTLHRKPQVFLLADDGYPGYASLLLASEKLIATRPQTVNAFVEATIEGWRRYLHGDAKPGNDLIKAQNAEMTDELLAQAIDKLKSFEIVEGGDAKTHGIGIMTDARWQSFFDTMVKEGVYPKDLPYKNAYTTAFLPKPGRAAP
jgi:NitT/TauT family transport system substrate-binding protein